MREFNSTHILSLSPPTHKFRSSLLVTALVAALGLVGCSTVAPTPVTESPSMEKPVQHRIHSATFSVDGASYFYAEGGETCLLRRIAVASDDEEMKRELGFCPSSLTHFEDGGLLAAGGGGSEWILADGSVQFEGRMIMAAASPSRFLEKTPDGLRWTDGEEHVLLRASDLRNPRIASGETLLGIVRTDAGESLVRFDDGEPNALTPVFPSIGSYDISPKGNELIFSAERGETGFDVGLVSIDGSEIIWVPADPADERLVSWAPRGNKITYTIESHDATILRSVHIPTTFQLTFDAPTTSVKAISWEPKAEMIAIVIESPTSGPRIDLVEYDGDNRRPLVGARESVDSTIDITTWEGGSGFLLGPTRIRYDARLPVAVWIVNDGIFDWRPAVAKLREGGVAVVLARGETAGDVRAAFDDIAWADPNKRFVVDTAGVVSSIDGIADGQTLITDKELKSDGERRTIRITGAGSFEDAAVDAILAEVAK